MPLCEDASLYVCAIRLSRLDCDGGPANAPALMTDGYENCNLVRLGVTLNQEDGEEFTTKTCGCVCVTYAEPDQPKNFSLELERCHYDPIIAEMGAGYTLVTDVMGNPNGWEIPSPGSFCPPNQPCGVGFEAWAQVVDSAGSQAFVRFTWPKVIFSMGDLDLTNALQGSSWEGQTFTNAAFTNQWTGGASPAFFRVEEVAAADIPQCAAGGCDYTIPA